MLLFDFYSTLVATWWIAADIETREGNSDSEMWFKETVNRRSDTLQQSHYVVSAVFCFSAEFQGLSGLIAVDSDHLCVECMWLLIHLSSSSMNPIRIN